MKILGIHDGHNASACLLEDGAITFCLQEERPANRKNFAGPPLQAIGATLEFGGVSLDDLDGIAVSSFNRYVGYGDHREQVARWRDYRPVQELSPRRARVRAQRLVAERLRDTRAFRRMQRWKNIRYLGYLRRFGRVDWDKVRFYDHHLMHAATGYYASPWGNDERPALVLTLDGGGDGLCATVSVGSRGRLRRIAETGDAHSLGVIWEAVTAFLGFVPLEHEYKLMGMAPYASPARAERCYDVFRGYLGLDETGLGFRRRIPEPLRIAPPAHGLALQERLRRDLAYERFDNVCHGLQRFTEELLAEWVQSAIERTGIHRVVLSGGVFMNVKANGRIAAMPEVEELFIPPSCGDESNAMGAAWQMAVDLCTERGLPPSPRPLTTAYLGPEVDEGAIDAALASLDGRFVVSRPEDMEGEIARLLAEGQIVARVAGRLEFGARALGNRSILADPARLEAVATINHMIKSRDFWMPFAPVVMEERASDYLVVEKGIASPYMMLTHETVPERRCELRAAMHQFDHTARPQVLRACDNPAYHAILKHFEAITGRGALLNTSYNLHGYPLVYGAEEALWVMANSGLRYLALGGRLIERA